MIIGIIAFFVGMFVMAISIKNKIIRYTKKEGISKEEIDNINKLIKYLKNE